MALTFFHYFARIDPAAADSIESQPGHCPTSNCIFESLSSSPKSFVLTSREGINSLSRTIANQTEPINSHRIYNQEIEIFDKNVLKCTAAVNPIPAADVILLKSLNKTSAANRNQHPPVSRIQSAEFGANQLSAPVGESLSIEISDKSNSIGFFQRAATGLFQLYSRTNSAIASPLNCSTTPPSIAVISHELLTPE